MSTRCTYLLVTILLACGPSARAIGVRTHAEIGRIAAEEYLAQPGPVPGIAPLFENEDNVRALYSGCAFPDWGYGGINQDAAEFSHWHRFMEAYLSVLQRRFPPPWDAEAQRQICFFLGVLCHNIADIPWHFDEDEHKSFLSAGYEADDASHGAVEFGCDYFLYAEKALEPSVSLEAWFPIDLLKEVFVEAGRPVDRVQLFQGTFRARVMFFGGPLVAAFQRNARKAAMPWVYDHYRDYYYGGMEHGAAVTAVMARYMAARLNGDYFYQNTPTYSSYVRQSGDYVPRLQIEDASVGMGENVAPGGTGPFLEIGGGEGSCRYGLLRVDLRDIPPGTALERATLCLHLAGDPVPVFPVNLEACAVLKPWDAVTESWRREGAGDNTKQNAPAFDAASVSPPVATVPLTPEAEGDGWIKLDITETAARWVADPETNNGVLVRIAGAEGAVPKVRFHSSEAFQREGAPGLGGREIAWRPAFLIVPRK